LGIDIPKLLLPLGGNRTVWDILYAKIAPQVQHVQVILHPSMVRRFEEHLSNHPHQHATVSYAFQETPRGMGDAVFCGRAVWEQFTDILVVWGDQVALSSGTIERTLSLQHSSPSAAICLPLCRQAAPYVDYILNDAGKFIRVLLSREGDVCRPNGLSDVGVFALSTLGLTAAWEEFLTRSEHGRHTGEVNFLPFLPYLSSVCDWCTQSFEVHDICESRGINTPEDLAFFKQAMATRFTNP
jgi:bifunctional UDP-N-acetylglucosamine pyrophosphorylase/glucosamine-1-phosphate N-acetyltransferase